MPFTALSLCDFPAGASRPGRWSIKNAGLFFEKHVPYLWKVPLVAKNDSLSLPLFPYFFIQ
jgi:hypothetical protein